MDIFSTPITMVQSNNNFPLHDSMALGNKVNYSGIKTYNKEILVYRFNTILLILSYKRVSFYTCSLSCKPKSHSTDSFAEVSCCMSSETMRQKEQFMGKGQPSVTVTKYMFWGKYCKYRWAKLITL